MGSCAQEGSSHLLPVFGAHVNLVHAEETEVLKHPEELMGTTGEMSLVTAFYLWWPQEPSQSYVRTLSTSPSPFTLIHHDKANCIENRVLDTHRSTMINTLTPTTTLFPSKTIQTLPSSVPQLCHLWEGLSFWPKCHLMASLDGFSFYFHFLKKNLCSSTHWSN